MNKHFVNKLASPTGVAQSRKNYQCSTEGQKRQQNLTPVLVIILGNRWYFLKGIKRDKLKGTNGAKFVVFRRFSLFLGIAAFRKRRFLQKTAGKRRFAQKTADFCRNWFVLFSLSLLVPPYFLGEFLPVLAFTGAAPRRVSTSGGTKPVPQVLRPCPHARGGLRAQNKELSEKAEWSRNPWATKLHGKTGALIYLPATSRPLIFLQKEAVLAPCNFATTHLTACILNFYLP